MICLFFFRYFSCENPRKKPCVFNSHGLLLMKIKLSFHGSGFQERPNESRCPVIFPCGTHRRNRHSCGARHDRFRFPFAIPFVGARREKRLERPLRPDGDFRRIVDFRKFAEIVHKARFRLRPFGLVRRGIQRNPFHSHPLTLRRAGNELFRGKSRLCETQARPGTLQSLVLKPRIQSARRGRVALLRGFGGNRRPRLRSRGRRGRHEQFRWKNAANAFRANGRNPLFGGSVRNRRLPFLNGMIDRMTHPRSERSVRNRSPGRRERNRRARGLRIFGNLVIRDSEARVFGIRDH